MTEKELEKFLSGLKAKIKPSKQLAQKIVADLEIREKSKGRLSGYELNFNQTHNLMKSWKVIIPAAVVVLLLLIVGFSYLGPKRIQPTSGPQDQLGAEQEKFVETPNPVPVPKTTGDINDTIDALTALSENEMVIITEEGNDASLVTLDSQAISDFGQSYDENEF